MRRKKPIEKCYFCGRLDDGQFTEKCSECKNRYSSEYRSANIIEYNGRRLTVEEWARVFGYSRSWLSDRLRQENNDYEKVFTEIGLRRKWAKDDKRGTRGTGRTYRGTADNRPGGDTAERDIPFGREHGLADRGKNSERKGD